MSGRLEPVEPGGAVAVGELRTVVRQADPAPAALGGHYRRIGAATVDEAGAVTFVAELSGAAAGSAIVRVTSESTAVLLRAGEPAPGGGRFAAFADLDAGEDGRLLFRARLAGGAGSDGIFQLRNSAVTAVARAGEPTPGGRRHRAFGQLALSSFTLDSGDYFRLAYLTTTDTGERSLVVWPCYREPSEVLTTGDHVAGGTLVDLVMSRLGLGLCAIARVRHGATVRQVPLLVSEDQVIWGSQLRQGGHLPGLGRIDRLLAPPAVFVHHGLVAVTYEGRGTALVTRPGGGEPEVFTRSGEPAPGTPDDRIDRLGPPVANSGLPEGGDCGVASLVRLGSGADALWSGVFPSQRPMAGAAVIPLVAGDHTDDLPPARVDRFRPIKLTNGGTLLLRATMDVNGERRCGLLLLHGLINWYHGP